MASQYGVDRRPVQAILANNLALEFEYRNSHVEAFFPVRTAVYIPDFDIQSAANQRQEVFEKNVT